MQASRSGYVGGGGGGRGRQSCTVVVVVVVAAAVVVVGGSSCRCHMSTDLLAASTDLLAAFVVRQCITFYFSTRSETNLQRSLLRLKWLWWCHDMP